MEFKKDIVAQWGGVDLDMVVGLFDNGELMSLKTYLKMLNEIIDVNEIPIGADDFSYVIGVQLIPIGVGCTMFLYDPFMGKEINHSQIISDVIKAKRDEDCTIRGFYSIEDKEKVLVEIRDDKGTLLIQIKENKKNNDK